MLRFPVTFAANCAAFPVSFQAMGSAALVVDFGDNINVTVGGQHYVGPTTVTPSAAEQTLLTRGMIVDEDIVINPVPNNYGLITWDGSALTVS